MYADLHVFRIHNQQWQVVRVNSVEQPPARYYHQQLQWEDLLFVLGGSGMTEDVNFQSLLWCLDINSLFWSKISCAGAIPPSVSSGTMVALHNQARQRREVRSAQSFVEEHSFSARNHLRLFWTLGQQNCVSPRRSIGIGLRAMCISCSLEGPQR